MVVRLINGNCLDVLATLPDASVHCVVTSPPYWGLRDYKLPPSIWGGDAACEHVWGAERVVNRGPVSHAASTLLGTGHVGWSPKMIETPRAMEVSTGAFCQHCGAWRGCLGLEPDHRLYVEHMVRVFREVWRVLRPDGTVWLNLGDSYAGSWGAQSRDHAGKHASNPSAISANQIKAAARKDSNTGSIAPGCGLKPKDLVGIPWRVAFALQDDGWWLRRDIIWKKVSCMPESCTDRCTTAHEYVFHLVKSGDSTFWTHRDRAGTRVQPAPDYRWVHRETKEERADDPGDWGDDKAWRRINLWDGHDYYYDAEAIAEPIENGPSDIKKMGESRERIGGAIKVLDEGKNKASLRISRLAVRQRVQSGRNGATRNARSVWTITPTPFKGSHFANMPPDLAERCILAGSSARGCCATCAAPFSRVLAKGAPDLEAQRAAGGDALGRYFGQSTKGHDAAGVQNASDVKRRILEGMRPKITLGWRPTCDCPPVPPVPCTVLDPFFGAATTGLVSGRLGRDCIGIELNPEYAAMAESRMVQDSPLFAAVTREVA
jgi:DNA modification methylase